MTALESFYTEGGKKLTRVPLFFQRSSQTAFGGLPWSTDATPHHPPRGVRRLRASGGSDSSPDPSTVTLPTTSRLFGGSAFPGNRRRSARGTQGKEGFARRQFGSHLSHKRAPRVTLEPPRRTSSPRATFPARAGIAGRYRKRKGQEAATFHSLGRKGVRRSKGGKLDK